MNPVLPMQLRDTREQRRKSRGATPTAADPSALAILFGLVGTLLRAMPWHQVSLGVVVAALAAMMPWAVGQTLGLMDREFESIHVEGELQRMEQSELMDALEPLIGQSYFASNLSGVKQQIEAMPWVQSAAVSREWPGTLNVDIIEHHPVARWNGQALLNRDGEVFQPANAEIRGIPVLSGPRGSATKVLAQARAFSGALVVHDLRLARLELESRGAWTLHLDNGISVALGRDRTEERFQRFLAVYESQLAPVAASVARVDARYGNGVAVSWRDTGGAANGGDHNQG